MNKLILKLVGGTESERIRFDAKDDATLAKQLMISEKKIEKETIDFETSDASVHLYLFDNLNIVLFYDFRTSYDSVLYVCTNREEALLVFRQQTIQAGFDEYSGDDEKEKVERTLNKYGLLDDLRDIFKILEELGGKGRLEDVVALVESKRLGLAHAYPSVSFSGETDEWKSYVASLADILGTRGYLERLDDSDAWRIVKPIDF